ncbi:MAG: zinc ribbon domain-containing protein [Nitrospinae bacterium]|nr:zinc ribbon domain-containing protein [Nitrospinota bacterium]
MLVLKGMQCPKCRKEIADTAVECPHCHIQVRMYLKKLKQKAEDAKKAAAAPPPEDKKGFLNPVIIIIIIVAAVFGYYHFAAKGKKAEVQQPSGAAPAPAAAPVEKLPVLEDVQPAEERPESAISGQEAVGKVDKIIERTSPYIIGHPKPPSRQD